MNYGRLKRSLYYAIKPILPRSLQILLRQKHIIYKARRVGDVWPIDASSGARPDGWRGWPAGRTFAFVLTHDVESERGVRRCRQLAQAEKERGFVSSFNFVPEKYPLSPQVRNELVMSGFEVGVHDLRHDGRLFSSEKAFLRRVHAINRYLESWNSVGFRSGSMYHNLGWMHHMRIEYDSSTFDTDPFEPQPDGMHTVFPLWIASRSGGGGYVELPYTLPQDMTLFALLQHVDTRMWKEKLEWIAGKGGMVLFVSHPDYMNWRGEKKRIDEYPFELYCDFLDFVKANYKGQYWNALPRDVARYWKSCMAERSAVRR
jgi:hypothetical protein